MGLSVARLPIPEVPGSVSGAPHLPEGFPARSPAGTFTPGTCASMRSPEATGRRRCCWCTAGPRPGTPGAWKSRAGPGLPGRRTRPARVRAVGQAPRWVRHRHPRQRPCRADGHAGPPAIRRGRPRHRHVDRLRPGRGSPGPGGPAGCGRGGDSSVLASAVPGSMCSSRVTGGLLCRCRTLWWAWGAGSRRSVRAGRRSGGSAPGRWCSRRRRSGDRRCWLANLPAGLRRGSH